jgi:hypothetical protein
MKRQWVILAMTVAWILAAAYGVSETSVLGAAVRGEDVTAQKDSKPTAAPATSRKAGPNVGWAKNPLTVAAYEGDLERVRALIKSGAAINDETGGWSAMEAAANGGYSEIVKALIGAGADVKGRLGRKAMKHAIVGGHKETARLLIKEGVDVKGDAKKEFVPLAIRSGHPEMLAVLHEADGAQ